MALRGLGFAAVATADGGRLSIPPELSGNITIYPQ
jgi:hypothetical protein